MHLRPILLLLCGVALCFAAQIAWAQHGGGRGLGGHPGADRPAPPMPMPPPQRRGGDRDDSSLSDSVRRVERDTGGQVLSAERMQSDGRDVNRVKVVDGKGRVRVFMDNPPPIDHPPRTRDNDD